MRLHGLFFGVLSLLTLAGGAAHACRCVEPPVAQAYRRADLVVVVTIDAVDNSRGDIMKASATVSEAWKMMVPKTVTFLSSEDCAYKVKAGQKHLLFLYRGERGIFGTIRCRGNLPVASAQTSLGWLKRYGKRSGIETVK